MYSMPCVKWRMQLVLHEWVDLLYKESVKPNFTISQQGQVLRVLNFDNLLPIHLSFCKLVGNRESVNVENVSNRYKLH